MAKGDKEGEAELRADQDRLIAEVADVLREKGFDVRVGWDSLDGVQRADAVELFMREVHRHASSQYEGRHIDRDEYDERSPRQD